MNLFPRKAVGIAFLASLVLNALFIYNTRFDRPDVDFYSHSRSDSYRVVSHERGDYFIIEHAEASKRRHRYTARCRQTLSWMNGIVNPGLPMSETCIYLPSLVGKIIATGIMRKDGDTLVYMPWLTEDTVQTADVLTIVHDEQVK